MFKSLALATSLACLMGAAAHAETVYNTALAPIPGTTTDASGTRTTSAGARESAPAVLGVWGQSDVGGGGTAGITTDYARNGNGSAYFSTTSGDSKAGLVDYFTAAPIALSTLSNVSFDFYRSSSSTVAADLAPVLRLNIDRDGVFAGSLIFENAYQNTGAPSTNTWTTLSATLDSGIFWASKDVLGPSGGVANGGEKTLQAWIDGNATHTLSVTGLEIGVGSGWSGTFSGAVDNVNLAFANGTSVNSNFEVAPAISAAPEPGTWALMFVGVGMAGTALRRRKTQSGAALGAT